MNHELKAAYHALSDNERHHLKQEFANSPKALLLLDFLDGLKGKDFNNQQVIPYIYHNETDSFETLRNRYFKLRKSLLDSIQNLQRQHEAGEGFSFPDEQRELYHLKQLIRDAQYGIARPKLEVLVKKLWQENIFEILPEAIQSLVYCRQVLGEYRQNAALLKEWELAVELQRDINQVRLLSTAAFNGFYDSGIQKMLEVMMLMKRIVQKRTHYPRFAITYHLSHVLNGTATLGNRPGALTRHLKEYNRLRKEHPTLPGLNYESNYLWIERYRYLYAKGLYDYIKNDYTAFYQSQVEAFQLTSRIPELKSARSEPMFLNKIRTEALLGYYHDALQTARDLQEFQKEHRLGANTWKTFLEMGRIYVYSMPKVGPDNLKTFIDTLERNLNTAASTMSAFDKGEAYGVVAMLRFYNQEYKAALKTYEKPDTKTFFDQSGISVFHEIFKTPLHPSINAHQLAKDLKKNMYSQENPALRNLLIRGAQMLDGYLLSAPSVSI